MLEYDYQENQQTYTKYNADGTAYILIKDEDADFRKVNGEYCYAVTGEAVEKFAKLERMFKT